SHTVFNSTLHKLVTSGQVDRYPKLSTPGKTVKYSLTEQAKVLRKHWNVHDYIETRRKSRIPEPMEDVEKNKRKQYLVLLLLYKATLGSGYLHSHVKPEPGHVAYRNYHTGAYDNYSYGHSLGVAERDIVSHGQFDLNGAFAYIDFSISEVKKIFNELLQHDPSVIRPIFSRAESNPAHNRRRFVIADELLKEYLQTLFAGLYSTVPLRMEETWQYIRWPNPKSGEADWYLSQYGKKRLVQFAKRAIDIRKKLLEKSEKEKLTFLKSVKESIRNYDKYVRHWYKVISSPRYKTIKDNYRDVITPIIEIVYPKFLRELHTNNQV
ncbi:MAG: hypothetical protein ACR2IS_00935, partial [Nitrososphaeraceae archaeon]